MKHEMNLLPVVPGKKKREGGSKNKSWIIFIGLLLGVLTIYGVLAFLDLCCQNEIRQQEAMIESKSEYQIIYANLSLQKEVLEHRRLLIDSISKGKALPLQTMVEIREVLPAGIRLSYYDFQDGRLIISGETQNKEEIMEFKEKLSAREVFRVINMVNTNIKEGAPANEGNGEAVWEFTFDIQVTEVQQ
jgi:hypothetical protein